MWQLWFIIPAIITLAWKIWNAKVGIPDKLLQGFPGPKPLPLLGNILDVGLDGSEFLLNSIKLWKKYGTIVLLRMGHIRFFIMSDPRDVQVILCETKYNNKGFPYNFVRPWLGTGLLTSNGEKWHKHRKLITPTFHFRILEQMTKIFNKQGDVLIDKWKEKLNEGSFDICTDIDLYTQDVICESAMGVNLHAQKLQKTSSKYVRAVKKQTDNIVYRGLRPWLYMDSLFNMTAVGRRQVKTLAVLHGTTNDVIAKRKKILISDSEETNTADDDTGIKKRYAFLDLLLKSSDGGRILSDTDIREEVDTFMFEGHDTTSTGICFTLFELSRNPDVQFKVYEELKQVMGDELTLTLEKLHELKYLECVVKEGLRLYPSVPLLTRELKEGVQLQTKDLTIPAGCIVGIAPFAVHRHPEFFPDPERFNPDHFLPERSQGRHAYAYIPFSAGPRNCIGQKFALLEMKSVISKIIWNFKLLPVPGFEPHLVLGLTLNSKNGLKLELASRNRAYETAESFYMSQWQTASAI